MSFSSGPVFTSAGRALHARAIGGAALTFTKMEMGDGSRGSASIDSLTALVHTVASVGISSLQHSGDFATIIGMFSNEDLDTGFDWNEIGLFAADPDHPNDRARDILYCYQDAAGNPDYIPASGSELITKRISIAAIVSNATNVTATFGAATAAADVGFDNEGTDLAATNVQEAIKELHTGKADLDASGKVPSAQLPSMNYIPNSAKGAANGVATLGADGKVPSGQLRSVSSLATATLTASGWALGADGRYSQSVPVANVTTTTELVIVDCNLTTDDADARVEILAAWAGPSANEVDQGNGTLTFYSYELPAVSILIFVGVV